MSISSLRPFIDIEASGFGGKSYPIEVGIVLADGQSYCTLIRPEDDWQHWDPLAERVHNIRRELLFQHGRDVLTVATDLNRLLRGMTVYTDAWYHDYTWLGRLFDAAGCAPKFRLEDLRAVLSDDKLAAWDSAKSSVMAELNLSRHRASNDARILQSTLSRLG